ncbi:E2F-associated phosphoprotein [Protopterus annectens]|uniref:E2F-associated phosphoprotein n=1 Tax=Protopterus annectens TaxID=7888 RepID=UPI001CFAAA05|nr:E2F-associated phosphoprotein [Protopterus annectens]
MNWGDESYVIEEPSDEERGSSSSEDELDVLLSGTPEQKRKLLREYLTGESESSSGDEFEKEMEAELNTTMKTLEGSWTSPVVSSGSDQVGTSGLDPSQNKNKPQYYDDIYFDTDSEDEEEPRTKQVKKKTKRKHRVLTNDELLYDPDADDEDQAWVDAHRRRHHGISTVKQQNQHHTKLKPLPASDAVLNCPGCMITLCLDCQRHEQYKTQYRAMFVMNCTINNEEVLKYKCHINKMRTKQHKKMKVNNEETTNNTSQEAEEMEVYHPVKCSECSTEVAVLDKDEVYHFFNVLASHC